MPGAAHGVWATPSPVNAFASARLLLGADQGLAVVAAIVFFFALVAAAAIQIGAAVRHTQSALVVDARAALRAIEVIAAGVRAKTIGEITTAFALRSTSAIVDVAAGRTDEASRAVIVAAAHDCEQAEHQGCEAFAHGYRMLQVSPDPDRLPENVRKKLASK